MVAINSNSRNRDTSTGLDYEDRVVVGGKGVDVSKHKMYRYLQERGINWKDYISAKLLPDEAYYDEDTGILRVYEKKFQKCEGSADEKLQTCAFKIQQYRKLWKDAGVKEVYYTYILCDWFKQQKYRDVLEYIENVPQCSYRIMNGCHHPEVKKDDLWKQQSDTPSRPMA